MGVVGNAKLNGLRGDPPAVFYRPVAQAADSPLGFVALRVNGPAASVQASVRAALARTESGLVFTLWRTLEERMVQNLGAARTATKIAGSIAAIAILLAAAGVGASLGYLVTLRQRELALRIALGANPRTIRRGVLVDAVRLGSVGAPVGLALTWLLPLIPPVGALLPSRPDLLVGLIAAGIGMAATIIAGWNPARRAARADLLLLLKLE